MKTFYSLLANTVISSITNFTLWTGITYFVYLQTQSVFATSIISGIYLVATASSGIYLGSIVDRYDKKSVMLASSLVSLIFYSLSFVLYFLSPAESYQSISNPLLWGLILLVMFGVLAGSVRTIALPTFVTLLVEEKNRDKANGLAGIASGVAFLVVSVISGFLVGFGGMYYILILGIVVTVISIIHLLTIQLPKKQAPTKTEPENKSKSTIDIKGTIAIISTIPGLFALIIFTTLNNFLGGVYMSLMDAYGLSLVSVQNWGLIWGIMSLGFIAGGAVIAKYGLGKKPLQMLFLANILIWLISSVFTIQSSIVLLSIGMFIYLSFTPVIEAAEHTIVQKLVPQNRQGRVFGFAQSIEQAASPFTAFLIGPIADFIFIPFMTTGRGVELLGPWFGTGRIRGIALVFTVTGIIGLIITILAMKSKYYKQLSRSYESGVVV